MRKPLPLAGLSLVAALGALSALALGEAPVVAQTAAPATQTPGTPTSPELTPARTLAILNHVTSTYRALQSYRDTASWTRKAGDKEQTATVTIAADRPGRYRLELKGEGLNTIVVDDGQEIVAIRPDRKAYIRVKAPVRLMGADVLANVDLPSPGARIITVLLENGVREPREALGKALGAAKVYGPQTLEGRLVYMITFRYDAQDEARVYVSDGDYLVRRVTLMRSGQPDLVEIHDPIETDQPIPASEFTLKLPEDAERVAVLPPLQPLKSAEASPAPDFTVEKADGSGSVHLADLKGRYVVVLFWSSDASGAAEEMTRLARLYNQYHGSGLDVVAINTGDQPDAALQFARGYGARFPIALNTSQAPDGGAPGAPGTANPADAITAYGVREVPTTFIVDREGRLTARIVGFSARDRRIEVALAKAGLAMD